VYSSTQKEEVQKVKGLDIYIPPLTLNDQQRFTVQSGVLTVNDTRWRRVSTGNPLPEWTDFGPHSLQL